MQNKIKELFNKSGWSMYRLSKESKISVSTLYEFLVTERVKSLSTNNLAKICNVFGVTIEYLLGEENKDAIAKWQQEILIADRENRDVVIA